jgi:hypothetical protein
MKSKFIGSKNLSLYERYSREDVGFALTQTALMTINEYEKIGFFNLGEKYDNYLTKKGFILNPRADLNNDRLICALRECTTYLFLRNRNRGLYYYVGICDYASRHDSTHLLLNLNVKAIPEDIIKKLGWFQPLP